MAKKEWEGVYEKYLKLFMPVWLTIEAIRMMLKEQRDERARREERESRF